MSAYYSVWVRGDAPKTASRRKADGYEEAALKHAPHVMHSEDVAFVFCVQRTGTNQVLQVEVEQAITRTAKVLEEVKP